MKKKRRQTPDARRWSGTGPQISYIVSAYDRPLMLPVCLWSIRNQSHQDFEVIVTDNATDPKMAAGNKAAVEQLNDPRFRYVRTAGKIKLSDCYYSAEYAIEHHARGSWYCFPCDDTYLVPEFGQRMLEQALRDNAGFVFCEKILVGSMPGGGYDAAYHIWHMAIHRTTKTTFMVKASVFPGFHGKANRTGACLADFILCSQMVEAGVKIGMVRDRVLIVHN